MKDTIIADESNVHDKKYYTLDDQGNLVGYRNYFYDITLEGLEEGRWQKAIIGTIDERSDYKGYQIIERDFANPGKPDTDYFFTVNDESLFTKPKKNIIDYYMLSLRMNMFSPDQMGGAFDVKNGYFEYETESTGAGEYVAQMVLFRTNEGRDLLGINVYGTEYIDYPMTSGPKPRFLKFEGNRLTEVQDVFPDQNTKLFFSRDYTGSTDVTTYYKLPQYGLSVKYLISEGTIKYCQENEASQVDKKEFCDVYRSVLQSEVSIAFDKASGVFLLSE